MLSWGPGRSRGVRRWSQEVDGCRRVGYRLEVGAACGPCLKWQVGVRTVGGGTQKRPRTFSGTLYLLVRRGAARQEEEGHGHLEAEGLGCLATRGRSQRSSVCGGRRRLQLCPHHLAPRSRAPEPEPPLLPAVLSQWPGGSWTLRAKVHPVLTPSCQGFHKPSSPWGCLGPKIQDALS